MRLWNLPEAQDCSYYSYQLHSQQPIILPNNVTSQRKGFNWIFTLKALRVYGLDLMSHLFLQIHYDSQQIKTNMADNTVAPIGNLARRPTWQSFKMYPKISNLGEDYEQWIEGWAWSWNQVSVQPQLTGAR